MLHRVYIYKSIKAGNWIPAVPFVEGITSYRFARKIHSCREVGYEMSAYSGHSPRRL